MRLSTAFPLIFLAILLVCAAGCQQRAASKLLGRWEGRPDSAATRAARDAEKYDDETVSGSATAPADKADAAEEVTDWERYDVKLVMDFAGDGQLTMSMDGAQEQTGSWQVVSTSASGCTIEVQTEPEVQTGAEDAEGEKKLVRRRFELLLDEREGVCVGFQLTESGADSQLGAIYFKRPEDSSAASAN